MSTEENQQVVEAVEVTEAQPVVEESKTETLPVVEGKTPEEVQAALEKSAAQVAFYFSDSNLPQDKFFFSLTQCNPEGWVPIKTILTFKRMREYAPIGVAGVAQGLRQVIASEGDDPLLAVSEDGVNVRRKRPLEPNSTIWNRSVYVKGFGEGDKEENTQEKIEEYFKQFGKVNAVRKRRGDLEGQGPKGKGKGAFKGSVFAEFAYQSDADKFLELESIPKFGEEDMQKMSKDAYVKMKAKEKGIPESEISHGRQDRNKPAKFNAFREMERAKKGLPPSLAKIPSGVEIVGEAPSMENRKRSREDDEEGGKGKQQKKNEPVTIEFLGTTLDVDTEKGTLANPEQLKFPEGACIKFLAPGEGADWTKLKEAVIAAAVLEQPFMNFPPGATSGIIAKGDNSAISDEEVEKLNAAGITYGDKPVTFERASEEEQRGFWTRRANFQASRAAKTAQEKARADKFRGHGGRGGRGGRGGKFGGRGGRGRGGKFNRDNRKESKVDSGMPPAVGAAN